MALQTGQNTLFWGHDPRSIIFLEAFTADFLFSRNYASGLSSNEEYYNQVFYKVKILGLNLLFKNFPLSNFEGVLHDKSHEKELPYFSVQSHKGNPLKESPLHPIWISWLRDSLLIWYSTFKMLNMVSRNSQHVWENKMAANFSYFYLTVTNQKHIWLK